MTKFHVLDANTGKPVLIDSVGSELGVPFVADAGVAAALAGRTFRKYLVDFEPGTDLVVLTHPDIVYNVTPGERVLISRVFLAVETTNDNCRFELGVCALPNGAGTFSRLTVPVRIRTTKDLVGLNTTIIDLHPPIVVAGNSYKV